MLDISAPEADQLKKPYFVMRDALNKVNRDIVIAFASMAWEMFGNG